MYDLLAEVFVIKQAGAAVRCCDLFYDEESKAAALAICLSVAARFIVVGAIYWL